MIAYIAETKLLRPAVLEMFNCPLLSLCVSNRNYFFFTCPWKSADLKSLDYNVVRAFIKIFKTQSKEVASCCMEMLNCLLPSVSVNNRKCKFLQRFSASENIRRHCVDCDK